MKIWRVDNNYPVICQVSCNGYDHKPTDSEIKTMCWSRPAITISNLIDYIKNGYTFVPFNRTKAKCHKALSNVLFIDIDHSTVSLPDYLDCVGYLPTVAYETYSNSVDNYCYRLVYVFSRPFYGSDFENVLETICTGIGLDVFDKRAVNQYYNGTYNNSNVVCTGNVYVLPVDGIFPLYSNEVITKYYSCGLSEFRDWCWSEYGVEMPVETPYVQKGDERILERPDNYLSLPIKRRWDKTLKTNVLVKWKDGEERHKKMWLAGNVLMRMCNDLDQDRLLYYIVNYYLNYIEDFDGKFNKTYLMELVERCFNGDTQMPLKSMKTRGYKVDPVYCALHKVSKREVANRVNADKCTAKRLERYAEIEKWYKPELADKENLKVLSDQGISISRRTLTTFKQWLKTK